MVSRSVQAYLAAFGISRRTPSIDDKKTQVGLRCNGALRVPHRPNALFSNGQVGGGGLMPAARFVGVLGSVRKSDSVRDSDGIHSLGEFVFNRTASVAAACTRYIASVFFKGRTSPAVEKCSRFSAARSPSLRIRCFDLP